MGLQVCSLQFGDCKAKALKSFHSWMSKDNPDTSSPIPKNTPSYTYCTAIRHGGEEELSFLWKRYLNSNVGNESSGIRNYDEAGTFGR